MMNPKLNNSLDALHTLKGKDEVGYTHFKIAFIRELLQGHFKHLINLDYITHIDMHIDLDLDIDIDIDIDKRRIEEIRIYRAIISLLDGKNTADDWHKVTNKAKSKSYSFAIACCHYVLGALSIHDFIKAAICEQRHYTVNGAYLKYANTYVLADVLVKRDTENAIKKLEVEIAQLIEVLTADL